MNTFRHTDVTYNMYMHIAAFIVIHIDRDIAGHSPYIFQVLN